MEQRVKEIMADVLALNPSAITDTTSMDSTASWDSLHHINLALAIEQEFNTALEITEIESMTSFAEIMRVLREKL
jgi:acyl carrier protein